MIKYLTLLFVLFCGGSLYGQGSARLPIKTKFSDYKVVVYKGPKADLNILGNPDAKKFRTTLKSGYKSGVNYAGHYCFVIWGCGSQCQQSAIIDAITGKVYNGLNSCNGFVYKKDSRLLVVDPPDSSGLLPGPCTKTAKYVFDDSTKTFKQLK